MLSKILNIPFYQDSWHNISLDELAKEYGEGIKQKSNSEVYEAFYQKFRENGYNFSQEFHEERLTVSANIQKTLDRLLKEPKKANILSIGSGLGLVEIPLLKKGYQITLQECNEASFDYIKSKNIPNLDLLVSEDLKDIPSNSFDFIYIHGVCYALSNNILKSFLKECSRILKPEGYISITGDGSYYWALIKTLFFKHNGILWGWKRPWWLTKLYAKQAGLSLLKHEVLGEDLKPRETRTFLTVPTSDSYLSDTFLFKKQ